MTALEKTFILDGSVVFAFLKLVSEKSGELIRWKGLLRMVGFLGVRLFFSMAEQRRKEKSLGAAVDDDKLQSLRINKRKEIQSIKDKKEIESKSTFH